MDLHRIATSIASTNIEAARRKKVSKPTISESVLSHGTEYSCQMEFALSADFEGNVAKKQLLGKLKSELVAAIKTAMGIVSRDLQVEVQNVLVNPIRMECVANHQMSLEEEVEDSDDTFSEFDEEEPEPKPKKKKKRKK